jgi:hypothetical protein
MLTPGYEDFEMRNQDKQLTTEKFREGASLEKGISGRHRIDTTFENTEARYVTVESRNKNPTGCPDPDQSQDWRCNRRW